MTKLVVDDVVHKRAVILIRYHDLDTMALLHSGAIKILLHGESRAEQADPFDTGTAQRVRGRVDDMQEGHVEHRFDSWRQLVHRVRAKHDKIGAAGFDLACRLLHLASQVLPSLRML